MSLRNGYLAICVCQRLITGRVHMKRQRKILGASRLAWSILGAAVAITGCTGDPPDPEGQVQAPATAAAQDGSSPISELPFVDAKDNVQVVAELLAKPTALGETTALHVSLPPPLNPE